MESDPFDAILGLEDVFYRDGYRLGKSDGEQIGLLEGRGFGIEKGFTRFLEMGIAHGHASTWAGRLSDEDIQNVCRMQGSQAVDAQDRLIALPRNARLVSHIQTLYAITEVESVSTKNEEIAIADFDARLKRAKGKMKVIEKIIGESKSSPLPDGNADAMAGSSAQKGDISIEDACAPKVGHK